MSTAAAPLHAPAVHRLQVLLTCVYLSWRARRLSVGWFPERCLCVLVCLRWSWTNVHSCCPIGLIICPTGLFCLDSEYVITLVRGLECDVPPCLATGVHRIQLHLAALHRAGSASCPVSCGRFQSARRCAPRTSCWAWGCSGAPWASPLSSGLRPRTCLYTCPQLWFLIYSTPISGIPQKRLLL